MKWIRKFIGSCANFVIRFKLKKKLIESYTKIETIVGKNNQSLATMQPSSLCQQMTTESDHKTVPNLRKGLERMRREQSERKSLLVGQ